MAERLVWSQGTDVDAVEAILDQAADAPTLVGPLRAAPAGNRALLYQASIRVVRKRLADRHQEKDRVLVQEVKAIDDLVRAANLLIERLREWYGLHAPEATRGIDDAEELARLVAEHGDRAAIARALDEAATVQASVGTDLAEADMAVLQSFAAALQSLHETWRHIERRVIALMAEIAPNLVAIVGPILGARLIGFAGSLQRLAIFSAGTVQTLGAETALFRHRKEGTKPPKHGILFQHPMIFQAPPWQRGAVARALAGHAVIAARGDALTGNLIHDGLQASLTADLERIAKRPRPARTPSRGTGTRSGPRSDPRSGPQPGKPRQRRGPQGKAPRGSGPGGKGAGGKDARKTGSGQPRHKGPTGPAKAPGGRR